MNPDESIRRLVLAVREYADGRGKDVARGLETPRLAALLVQKYGYGVAQAAAIIYGSAAASGAIIGEVDQCVAGLDPDWQQHAGAALGESPADVTMQNQSGM